MTISRILWALVKSVVGCVLFALGIITNVTPQQAQSNLSMWFRNPPDWMLPPNVDAWGEIFFFALAAVMFISVVWPWLYERKAKARTHVVNDQSGRFQQIAERLYPRQSWTKKHLAKAFLKITSIWDKSIPINEAARIAYQGTQDTVIAGWAASVANGSPDEILNQFAKYLGTTSARLFGIRPLMANHEEIPKAIIKSVDTEFRNGDLYDGSSQTPRYTRVCINRSDIKTAINELNSGPITPAPSTQESNIEGIAKQGVLSESAEVFRAKAELAKQERLRHKQEILERSLMRDGIANSKMLVPDWPIQELFFHIRPSLRTGEDLDYEATALAIKDKLSIGQLDIWGRAITFHGEDRPLRKISQTYWQKADFSYAFFFEDGNSKPHTRPDQDSELPEYYNLQVNRSQALTIWREPLVEKQGKWTWPALTKIEIDCVYTNLKEKGGQHSVHIACDNAQCEPLADSFATLFSRLGWPHHIGSGLFDAQGAEGILLQPDNETSRALKFAIEANTGLDVEILNTNDSGGSAAVMLIIGSATNQREDQESTDLWRGYTRAKLQTAKTKEAALLRLTQLRDEGTTIRNDGMAMADERLQDWVRRVINWMEEVIDTIRRIHEPDAVWFRTLQDVPPPSIPIQATCRINANKMTHENNYRQHAFRLVRLNELLSKYGVGA